MFIINKNLKIKEITQLLNNEVVAVPCNEALINTLSNNMTFLEATKRPNKDDIEICLAMTIRTVNSNELLVHDKNKIAFISPTLKNPFNPSMNGYFLYMYSLQNILGSNFNYPMRQMNDTVLIPTHIIYVDNKLYIVFSLLVKDELFKEFKYFGESDVLDLENKDLFTCESELDKIILATQKIVKNESIN